ncbi:MAG: hypothetical protein IKY24_05530 [Alistipes sp.]|nr:hypothetical protein [Alistipes sp.]
MNLTERKLLISLLGIVQNKSLSEAVKMMWQQGLLNRTALERLYIGNEVQRRVRAGEVKVRAIDQLSREMNCSYEKVRAAVYNKQIKKVRS